MTNALIKDITFQPVKGGIHAGGQHAQKNSTGVRATHTPSGIVCVIRGRSLKESKRKAVEEIRRRIKMEKKKAGDRYRKARWRQAIAQRDIIRTFNAKRNEVTDHRTGAKAPMDRVLDGDVGALDTLMYFDSLRRAELEHDEA